MNTITTKTLRKTVVAACVAAIFVPTVSSAAIELYGAVSSIERHPRPLGKVSANGTTVFVDASIEAQSQSYGTTGLSVGIRRAIDSNKLDIHNFSESDSFSSVVVRGGKAFLVKPKEMFTGSPLKYESGSVIELDTGKLPGLLTAKAVGTIPNYEYRFYVSSNREGGNWYITQDNKINFTNAPIGLFDKKGVTDGYLVDTIKENGSDLIVSDYIVIPDGLFVKSSTGGLYLVSKNPYTGVSALPVILEDTGQILGGSELNFSDFKNSVYTDTASDSWSQWYYFKSNGTWHIIEFTPDNQTGSKDHAY